MESPLVTLVFYVSTGSSSNALDASPKNRLVLLSGKGFKSAQRGMVARREAADPCDFSTVLCRTANACAFDALS
jgi:hypothetical protein